jgi:drug/metabolite transporter (DMT)-like permease
LIAAGLLGFDGFQTFTKDIRATTAQFISGIVLAVGNYVLSSALATNFKMGPYITGMLPINAVLLTVVCRIFLGEVTTPLQLVAILISIIGLALMATADLSPSGVRGVVYGLITAICYAIGNFGIKYASIRGLPHTTGVGENLPFSVWFQLADMTTNSFRSTSHRPWPPQLSTCSAAVLLLGMGLTGLGFFAVQTSQTGECFKGLDRLNHEWGGGDADKTGKASSRLYGFSALSGCLQTLAICCMKLAVSLGPAAPAMAIANSNAVGVLILNVTFFHTITGAQQLAG